MNFAITKFQPDRCTLINKLPLSGWIISVKGGMAGLTPIGSMEVLHRFRREIFQAAKTEQGSFQVRGSFSCQEAFEFEQLVEGAEHL